MSTIVFKTEHKYQLTLLYIVVYLCETVIQYSLVKSKQLRFNTNYWIMGTNLLKCSRCYLFVIFRILDKKSNVKKSKKSKKKKKGILDLYDDDVINDIH